MNSNLFNQFTDNGFVYDTNENIWTKDNENSYFTASIDTDGSIIAVMTNDDADYDEIVADTFNEFIEWVNNK